MLDLKIFIGSRYIYIYEGVCVCVCVCMCVHAVCYVTSFLSDCLQPQGL